MSLQVWLPLTKDLRQQGLSKVTVTNNGATFSSAGKLGGCYEFASGKRIQTTLPTSTNLKSKAISFACWMYVTSWNSSYDCFMSIADGTGWNQSRATLCRNNTASTLTWNIADGSNRAYVTTTSALPLNTWTHVAGTYDGTNLKIYINGVLNNTAASTLSINYAGTFNIGGWSGANYPFNGKLNDVRFYNHCLSSMEIKELARGLALHYLLNRNGYGQENLILESHKVTGGGNASGITRTYESDGSMKIVSASGNGNWCSLSFAKDSNTNVGNNMAVGNTYCISCDVKITNGTTLPTLFINSGNGYKQLRPVSGSIITNKWIRVYYNSTWANPGTDYGNISLHLGFSGVVGTYYFKNFKLEKGTIPTPWCPNIADSNNMGLNSTIEYDHSGFGNNGTRTGAFTWTGDTPKYTASTYMPKAALITHPRPVFGGTDQEWTCAVWVKLDDLSSNQALNNFNRSNYLTTGTNALLYLNDGANDYYNYANTKLTAGVWTHVVFVFKNSNATKRIYFNGEDKTNTSGPNKTSTPSGIPDTITVGTNLAGYISDYRIYATALSADDVKSLYQNEAFIDSSGTIYGQIR